ncbi:MAG: hypothetical protein KF864_06935 [Phycisphaeraceae bacterium]|nr:hypothetical protein [Phycisphaeraceae bacterium]MBX3409726.1 hypothetical protein [Phycisphaeraceae bacterium]
MAIRRGQRPIDEGPSEQDIERFSDVTTQCPECRAALYDDVSLCWKCGYALGSRRGGGKRPIWVPVIALTLVLLFVLYSLR